ncbi:hypothetical protein PILCRDRAFT_39012, partial [Piloderma croceum F 1598]
YGHALYTFKATEFGDLGFKKGDMIEVVDSTYGNWWTGQLAGRFGIFPANYV